jgi:hypothetical protein
MPMLETARRDRGDGHERAPDELYEIGVERRAPQTTALRVARSSGERLLLLAPAVAQIAWLVTRGYLAHRFVLSPILEY